MRIALAQLQMEAATEANLEKTLQSIERAAANKADLIFFPEIQLYPFFPQYENRNVRQYVLTTDHDYIRQIKAKCREHMILASPNVYFQENGKNYDASLFIDASGEISGISKMVHIMQSQYFYEQDYYTPSDDGFKVYDTLFGKVGIVICFDRHLPESIRSCVAQGADLILIPTANIAGEPLEMFEWEIRVQAMQSSVYLAMCNRVGKEGQLNFAGRSIVVDPSGDIVVKAGGEEMILYADIDLNQSKEVRNLRHYFNLRRTDMYR